MRWLLIAGLIAAVTGVPLAAADGVAVLRSDGIAALNTPLRSVMDKGGTAPSGDKHDYFSVLPYWWPNPDTADGLPYVNRDGEVNPEARSDTYDRTHFFEMAGAVEKLSWAYVLDEEARFAAHCAALIRRWFLRADTAMNPNLEWAQCKPGTWEQQPNGIIRGMSLLAVHEAVERIRKSDAWTEEDEAGWRDWTTRYVHWLRTSPLAQKERGAFNNHGTWYDVQIATFGQYCGAMEGVTEVLEQSFPRRVQGQFRADGGQPYEQMRTKAWDYSVMNLTAFFALARVGASCGKDLWHYTGKDGRGIQRTLDHLLPYATGAVPWPHGQITGWHPESLYPLLKEAARVYGSGAYDEAANMLKQVSDAERFKTAFRLGLPVGD